MMLTRTAGTKRPKSDGGGAGRFRPHKDRAKVGGKIRLGPRHIQISGDVFGRPPLSDFLTSTQPSTSSNTCTKETQLDVLVLVSVLVNVLGLEL